ncbi:MAG: substrate-binding domain-containing protein [Clostridia bacterium]
MKRNIKKTVGMILVLTLALTCAAGFAEPFDTSAAIAVISREDGSGTRGAFVELTGIEVKDDAGEKIDRTTEEAIVTNATSVMMTTVAGNASAIGYISLGSLNDTVKALTIDGAQATTENVKDGSYAIARPFNIATKGTPSALAADFMAFIRSRDGQDVVCANGYIDVSDDAAYAGTSPAGKLIVAGSSSVTPVMEKLKEAYLARNPAATIELQQSDSTTGANAAIDGIADIGMVSRDLKDSELEKGLVPVTIAMDGIAVIVNNENPQSAMTREQVCAVFTGEAATWADIGA